MAKKFGSRFGTVEPLKNNPRKIDSVAFTNLVDSLRRDPEYMPAHRITLDEENNVLGGNQRIKALLYLRDARVWEDKDGEGFRGEDRERWHRIWDWLSAEHPTLPDEWVCRLERPEGMGEQEWKDKKSRFILVDNSPEGMAGEFDAAILEEFFSRQVMKDAGMDFSMLSEEFQMGEGDGSGDGDSPEDRAEKGEMGAKNPKMQEFIDARENSRGKVKAMNDTRFYTCFIWKSKAQRDAFLMQTGMQTRFDGLFANGEQLAEMLGVSIPKADYVFPEMKPVSRLAAMAMTVEGEVEGVAAEAKDDPEAQAIDEEKGADLAAGFTGIEKGADGKWTGGDPLESETAQTDGGDEADGAADEGAEGVSDSGQDGDGDFVPQEEPIPAKDEDGEEEILPSSEAPDGDGE